MQMLTLCICTPFLFQVMDGSLPTSLKHIISNAEYYGPSLFLLGEFTVAPQKSPSGSVLTEWRHLISEIKVYNTGINSEKGNWMWWHFTVCFILYKICCCFGLRPILFLHLLLFLFFGFLATEVVTVFVFQEPSLLSSLQDNGLTDVMLHALLIKDVSFQTCNSVLHCSVGRSGSDLCMY